MIFAIQSYTAHIQKRYFIMEMNVNMSILIRETHSVYHSDPEITTEKGSVLFACLIPHCI